MSTENTRTAGDEVTQPAGNVHIQAETVYYGVTTQKTVAGTVGSGKAKIDIKSTNCSQKITSQEGTQQANNEDEGLPRHEQRSETENADAALNAEPMKTNKDGPLKRQKYSSNDDGPSQKISKNEPAHLPEADAVRVYLAAEHAETLMREKKQFSEAQTALMKVGRTSATDCRFKLLLAECKLRLGLLDDTKQAIADVADFMKFNSSLSSEELFSIVSGMIKNKKQGRAMVLLASHVHVLAVQSNIKNRDQAVFEISTCIKSFSDAVRAIPDKKRKGRKNAAKEEPTQPSLKKRFGVWYESLSVFNPIMEDMLVKLRSLGGTKVSSEAYALNWMSSASYFVQKRDQGLVYSRDGVNILQNRGGAKYHTFQPYAELLHNLGRGTAMCGDVEAGLAYLEKSLKHKQNDVKFDSDRKKEASIAATQECIKFWGK